MTKKIVFTENDEKLVDKIRIYQKQNGFTSFVSAVRKLCEDALRQKKIIK